MSAAQFREVIAAQTKKVTFTNGDQRGIPGDVFPYFRQLQVFADMPGGGFFQCDLPRDDWVGEQLDWIILILREHMRQRDANAKAKEEAESVSSQMETSTTTSTASNKDEMDENDKDQGEDKKREELKLPLVFDDNCEKVTLERPYTFKDDCQWLFKLLEPLDPYHVPKMIELCTFCLCHVAHEYLKYYFAVFVQDKHPFDMITIFRLPCKFLESQVWLIENDSPYKFVCREQFAGELAEGCEFHRECPVEMRYQYPKSAEADPSAPLPEGAVYYGSPADKAYLAKLKSGEKKIEWDNLRLCIPSPEDEVTEENFEYFIMQKVPEVAAVDANEEKPKE